MIRICVLLGGLFFSLLLVSAQEKVESKSKGIKIFVEQALAKEISPQGGYGFYDGQQNLRFKLRISLEDKVLPKTPPKYRKFPGGRGSCRAGASPSRELTV